MSTVHAGASGAAEKESAIGVSSMNGAGSMTGVSSMTGYARVAGRVSDALSFTLTLKSINHRYLDMQLRMPPGAETLEAALRQRLKEQLIRGHVECVLTLERNKPLRGPGVAGALNGVSPSARPAAPIFDPAAVAAYITSFREAARLHGLSCEPDLNQMARVPGMLLQEQPDGAAIDRTQEAADEEALAREVLSRLGEVLAALRTMRTDEGAALAAILLDGLQRLELLVEEVAVLRASVQQAHFLRIRQRLDTLLGGSFDRERVLQEAALLAERSDVEEEVARMRTHIQHFRALLGAGGELGKKLDFLLQEMNREANTLLSKTAGVTGNGTRITECGLAMKAEIEKLREQVQNLE
ncbi:MAG TPA: DUF1732 domain-containing protein [Acidobacteriaceae bacterium]